MARKPISFSIGGTGAILYESGTVMSQSTSTSYTDYVNVSSYKAIQYKCMMTSSTSGTITIGMAFYDTNKTYISGDPMVRGSSSGYAYGLKTLTIPSGAVYARFTAYKSGSSYETQYGTLEVYGFDENFGIIVDNTEYLVGLEYDSLKRKFSHVEGPNTGTSILGRTIRDILGSAYTYSMTIHGLEDYQRDYDQLYALLTDASDYHTVSLPFGQTLITFDAVIETADDTYKGYYNGQYRWDDLEVTFTPIEPQVT